MSHEVSEAHQIALESCDQLLAPKNLVQRIEKDLTAIRVKFPAVAEVNHTAKWRPGELMLLDDVDLVTLEGINYGTLGPCNYKFEKFFKMAKFQRPYNPIKLAEILKRDYGVQRAHSNASIGVSSTITLTSDSETYTYVFMKGWGDAPAGCIHKHFWTFTTGLHEKSVKLVDERGPKVPKI